MDAPLRLSCETCATRTGVTNFRCAQQPRPEPGKHGVVMLSPPSHGAQRMQLVNVRFFETWKVSVSSTISTRLREKPGSDCRQNRVAGRHGVPNGCNYGNGFRNRGFWPVDRNVFTHADFSPSVVTHATHGSQVCKPKTDSEI